MARRKKNNIARIIIWSIIVVVALEVFGIVDIGSILGTGIDPDFPEMDVYDGFVTTPACIEGYNIHVNNQNPDFDHRIYGQKAEIKSCQNENYLAFNVYDSTTDKRYPWQSDNRFRRQDISVSYSALSNDLTYDFIKIGSDNPCGASGWDRSYGQGYFIIKDNNSANWDILFYLNSEYKYKMDVGYFDELPEKQDYNALEDPDNWQCRENTCNGGNTSEDEHGCMRYSRSATREICKDRDWCGYYHSGWWCCRDDDYEMRGDQCCRDERYTKRCGGAEYIPIGAKYDDRPNGYWDYDKEKSDWYDRSGYTSLKSVTIEGDTTLEIERNRITPDQFIIKKNGITVTEKTINNNDYYLALHFPGGVSEESGRTDCNRPYEVEPTIKKVLYKVPYEGCTVKEGEVIVRKDFGAGSEINIESLYNLDAPLKRFCIDNPPQILKIGVGQDAEKRGQLFSEIVRGQTITVPDGFIYKISYVTNYQRGMVRDCPIGSAVINADTGECEEYATDIINPENLPDICKENDITDFDECADLLVQRINNLEGTLDDKIDIINQLEATIEEKAQIISQMEENIANQAQIIDNLEATIEEKSQIISNLNLEIDEQAQLISELEATQDEKTQIIRNLRLRIDDQAELIANLENQASEQANIIDNLRMTIDEQAQTISNMEQTVQEQASIIDNLRLTIDEKAELINNLNLEIDEQETIINNLNLNLQEKQQIIENLRITNEEQEELISRMRGSFEEQAEQIRQLNLTVQEDAELIQEYELSLEAQATVIQNLRLENDQQAELIRELRLENEELGQLVEEFDMTLDEKIELIQQLRQSNEDMAETINELELSNEELSDMISNLRSTVEDQAEIINNLELSNERMAELVQNLRTTTDDQAELISELELSNSEMYDLVQRLRLTTEQQQDLIDQLQSDDDDATCPAIVEDLPTYLGFDANCGYGWIIIVIGAIVILWWLSKR